MDKKIIDFLKEFDISSSERDVIVKTAPMLDVITSQEFAQNCALLVKYGYPKIDLDILLLSNPNIFVMSPEDLENSLKTLKKKYDDIEEILKFNPTII